MRAGPADPTDPNFCPAEIGPVQSGYHPPESRPVGKCTHLETNKDGPDGEVIINPDWSSPRGAFEWNNFTLHEFAKNVAMRHTKEIWGNDGSETPQGIKQALIIRFGQAQGQQYYDLLIKKHVSVGFIIDVDGKMADNLPIVKERIHAWVPQLEELQISARLTLLKFVNAIGPYGEFCNPDDFLALLDSTWLEGVWTDCPDAPLNSVLAGTELVGDGGTHYSVREGPTASGTSCF